MSTILAYACDNCGWPCAQVYDREPEHVWCRECGIGYTFAPWSYQEVLGAIGLEALYQKYVANCRPQLLLHVSRDAWIKIPAMEFLEPSQAVLALQAGVQFSTGAVLEQMQRAAQHEQMRRSMQLKRN